MSIKKPACVLFVAIGALAVIGLTLPVAAVAQTALERVESRLRQQLGGDAKQASPSTPPQPRPPAAPGETRPAKGGGWLGVVADDENDRGQGVRVLEVTPGGPAAKAGFRVQDLITSVGGIRVRQMSELADMIEMYKPGDVVNFEVQRNGKVEKFPATLSERPVAQRRETPAIPGAEPKSEPPLILPPQTPAAALPGISPVAPGDDRGRVEALERRIQQLEQRVAELERAMKPSPPPAK